MHEDQYLIEILAAAKNSSDKPLEQQARAGRRLMAYLSGRVDRAAKAGDPVAGRMQVLVHSMMPHLIERGE
ncbi:hypothetical protein [Marinobacter sp.]|uniref:hypothetical protein n=1 Tax=Marinobacter sp. TaxID=50741 RepID=UPI0035C740DC